MTRTVDRPAVAALLLPRDVVRSGTRWWWVWLLTGTAWLIVALILLRFDYTSVKAIGYLFGFLVLAMAVAEVGVAMVASGWWRVFHIVLAVVFFVTFVLALAHPGNTFVALAAVMSFFFVLAGTFDIIKAVMTREDYSVWWLQLLVGILELGIGFWAAGSWSVSAALLVAFAAAAAFIRGVTEIAFGLRLQHVNRRLNEA